jgi:hypothetical protein
MKEMKPRVVYTKERGSDPHGGRSLASSFSAQNPAY